VSYDNAFKHNAVRKTSNCIDAVTDDGSGTNGFFDTIDIIETILSTLGMSTILTYGVIGNDGKFITLNDLLLQIVEGKN
jgi:hypothetical protein